MTAVTNSPLSSGNRVAAVGFPPDHRFSRSPLSSRKRFPVRATRVRLRTVGPPWCGFLARRHTPSPTRNPAPSARVISWSYQSESAASFDVTDGSLIRTVSGPLPTSRRFEHR